MRKLVLYFDGCIKESNPGGVPTFGYCSFVAEDFFDESFHHTQVSRAYDGYGRVINCQPNEATNNTAEYCGLLAGVMHLGSQKAFDDCEKLLICGDSQLVIRQLSDQYAIRQPHLKRLADKIKFELSKYSINVVYKHVYRQYNSNCDDLANKAYNEYKKCEFFTQMDILDLSKI